MVQLATLDIVWCRFPRAGAGHGAETIPVPHPEDKVRPCLVLGQTTAGQYLVAYGTSQAHHAPSDVQLMVDPAKVKGTGLEKVTTFDLSRRRALPATDVFFPGAGKRPARAMGKLPQAAAALMAELRSCVEAARAQEQAAAARRSGRS